MKLLCVLVLLSAYASAEDFPPPVLGTASSRCFAEMVTPNAIPADPTFIIDEFGGNIGDNPLRVGTDSGISFKLNRTIAKIHYHFGVPELPEDFAFTLTDFELTVKQDNGKLLFNQRFSGDETGIIPPTVGEPGSLLIGSMVAFYEDSNGNEFKSQDVFFPPAESDRCCPLSHPPPNVFPETFDRLILGPNDHFEGADFVLHKNDLAWSWWCHNGVFKSCYVVPEGFDDKNLERFQETGGVATFFDENDGSPVRFECIFRTEGNDAAGADGKGNRVSGNLSGEFVRLDVKEENTLPSAVPGIQGSECQLWFDTPIDIPVSTQDNPFVFPPDTHINISSFNQAQSFNTHWTVPILDDKKNDLEVSGYELTVRELSTDRLITQNTFDSDVTHGHLDLTDGDLNLFVQTSIVTLFTDAQGNQVRSAEQLYPKSSLDSCVWGLPPPEVLPDNYDVFPTESNTRGDTYVVTKDGNTWTYFCNNGIMKSCYRTPDGWDDPNNQKYQRIGGKAFFRNIETGEHEYFVCVLSEHGDEGDEISGRFVSIGALTGNNDETSDIIAGIKDSNIITTYVLMSLVLILFIGFVTALYTAFHFRKKYLQRGESYRAFQQLQPLGSVQEQP